MGTTTLTVDDELYRKAEAVLRLKGMSTSSVVELLFARIAGNDALPFELFEPNAETAAAIGAARRGEGKTFGSLEELFADLRTIGRLNRFRPGLQARGQGQIGRPRPEART